MIGPKRYRVLLPVLMLTTVIFLISAQKAFAQNSAPINEPTLAWINVGFGPVAGDNMLGVGLITNVQYDSKLGLFGMRYFKADDTAMRTGFSNHVDDISELNIMYGYSHNFGILNLAASTGLGALWGENRGPGAGGRFSVLSFPVQGSITLQPVPIIGLGVMISTTVNSHSNISGAQIVLQLGRLR